MPNVNGKLEPLFDTADSLQRVWERLLVSASSDALADIRRRLRSHAIETGILERLYDLDWGVTRALVAEGISQEVAARHGGIDDSAFRAIKSQFEALEFLADAAREGRNLSVYFVKELHTALTGHQSTYEATDSAGRLVDASLHHGAWKTHANHVVRPDGSLLEYAPAEQVASEMDLLVEMFEANDDHPILRAAWLHHRFIQIHPFEDGNGRVARALVLLVLLRANFAPLVVDRRQRDRYLKTLDRANDGDLAPFARLLAELEIAALRSAIELPDQSLRGGTPAEVAHAVVDRIRRGIESSDREQSEKGLALAGELQRRIETFLDHEGDAIAGAFRRIDPHTKSLVDTAAPPAPEASYWYRQLVRTAKAAEFFANLEDGCHWVRLKLFVRGQGVRYVVAMQRVGRVDRGVLAVTVFAERVPPAVERDDSDEAAPMPISLLPEEFGESVTLVGSNTVDERWDEIQELLERTLAATVATFGSGLGASMGDLSRGAGF